VDHARHVIAWLCLIGMVAATWIMRDKSNASPLADPLGGSNPYPVRVRDRHGAHAETFFRATVFSAQIRLLDQKLHFSIWGK
jgi:hypothetical protein